MTLERFEEQDFFACCGSTRFAKEMASAYPFTSLDDAISAARNIWFNKVKIPFFFLKKKILCMCVSFY